MKRYRDSKLGRFIAKATATASPDTTTAETISTLPHKAGQLRWEVDSLKTAIMQAAGDLRTMVMHKSITEAKISAVADQLEKARDLGPR